VCRKYVRNRERPPGKIDGRGRPVTRPNATLFLLLLVAVAVVLAAVGAGWSWDDSVLLA
jgi:hypothetical protein